MALRILIAPTAFKGTLTPSQAARAIASGVREVLPDAVVTQLPVADGGDGFLECLAGDAHRVRRTVTGPLGGPVEAEFALRADKVAVIEMARASGLALLTGRPLDPLRATTRGTGELIRAAAEEGAHTALLGLGGSATNDGGAGCLSALGFRFVDGTGKDLPDGGGALADLARVIEPAEHWWPRLRCACDVSNPLLGPEGATEVFGPQKGAAGSEVRARLEAGLARLASCAPGREHEPMAGAAGGIAFGLATFVGAALERGSDLVLGELGFDERLAASDVLVTGEGRLDVQTLGGKVVGEVLRRGRSAGVRCYAVCGVLGDGWEAPSRLLDAPPEASEQPDPALAEAALADAARRLAARFA